jgi:hypothetical protein
MPRGVFFRRGRRASGGRSGGEKVTMLKKIDKKTVLFPAKGPIGIMTIKGAG